MPIPSLTRSGVGAKPVIGDEYVLIRRADTKNAVSETSPDEKRPIADSGPSKGLSNLMSRVRAHGAKPGGTIRVNLWQSIAQSQSTTALVTASALQPGSALSFSDFASVYDECRCTGVTIHAAASSGSLSFDCWGVAFDPGTTGNSGSLANVLEHKYHIGPSRLPTQASSGPTDGVASKTGFLSVHGKTVKQFVSSTTNDNIGSNWYPTNLTSSIIGYAKPYVENGAAGTVYLRMFVCYDMEFKYRS